MRRIIFLYTVIMVITFTCCGTSKHETKASLNRLSGETRIDLVRKVISEDRNGIKTRDDAVRFYRYKGVSLYFSRDLKLTSFDCSRPAGLTNDDMKYIVFFPEVEGVHLSDKNITDEVFYYLQDLKKITALSLYNTSVTGAGFNYLTDKSGLIIFDFGGSPVTDKGIEYISQISFSDHVIILNLKGSKITDEGMKYFEKIRFGKGRINLRNTSVTDKGIKNLAGFKDLVEVDLINTGVTESGGKWLKTKIPAANISWGVLNNPASKE